MFKRIVFCLLVLSMSISTVIYGQAKDTPGIVSEIVKKYESKKELTIWENLIIAVSGSKKIDTTYKKLENEVKSKKGQYRLQTDYAKLIITIKAMDKNPRNVAGYNLVEKLYNFSGSDQGINGKIWTLMALYNEKIPNNAKWNRDELLKEIINGQNKDGGFSLKKDVESEVDLTAMAISCLALYKEIKGVNVCIDAAIEYLSLAADNEGNYSTRGTVNCESSAQVIIALSSCGISIDDERFIHNKLNPLDVLYRYQIDKQGFSHLPSGELNNIATEQAVLAIIAHERYIAGLPGIYELVDGKVNE